MPLFHAAPWLCATPPMPPPPVGMLGEREMALFFHLARDGFVGAGAIVDAGSFLGRSAHCFAHGLAANRSVAPGRHRVHCFDNFLVNEGGTVDFLRERLSLHCGIGDSTRALFDQHTAPVRERLHVHAGDFLTIDWPRQAIEILMVDVAKSVALQGRVVELFFSDLIPGRSIVVQQDYHHAWLPHIHVLMEFLADHFECVAPRVDASAAFRCTTSIPPAQLQRAREYAFPPAEQLLLMDRAVERLAPTDRPMVQLARVVLQADCGAFERARANLDRLVTDAVGQSFADWQAECRRIRNHIDRLDGWRLLQAGAVADALSCAEAMLARGPRDTHALRLGGAALLRLGWLDAAESMLQQALALPVRAGDAHAELAEVLADGGHLDEAEAALWRGLSDHGAAYAPPRRFTELLAHVWERRGDPEHAQASLLRLCRLHGDEPEVWVLAARLQHAFRQDDAARCSLAQARAQGLATERLTAVAAELAIAPAE